MRYDVFSVSQIVGHAVLDKSCELQQHMLQRKGFGVLIYDAKYGQILYSAIRVDAHRDVTPTQTNQLLEDMQSALVMSALNVPPLGTHIGMSWPLPGTDSVVWMVRTNSLVVLCVGDATCISDECNTTAIQIAYVLCSMVNKWQLYKKEDYQQQPNFKVLHRVAWKALRTIKRLDHLETVENVLVDKTGTFLFNTRRLTLPICAY